jgi:hypothetical protein
VGKVDIGPRLLNYLRETLDAPDLEFALPPAALTGGSFTSIWSFGLGLNEVTSGPGSAFSQRGLEHLP